MLLRDGKVASVGSDPAPSGIRIVNARGRYVVPGLVDAHTHVLDLRRGAPGPWSPGSPPCAAAGVSNYFDVGFRELVKTGCFGRTRHPRLGLPPAPAEWPTRFSRTTPTLFALLSGVDTADELRMMARANLDRGVDWIKVLATERAGTADTDPRKQVYSEAELRAVVEEAGHLEGFRSRPTRTGPKVPWPRCAPG